MVGPVDLFAAEIAPHLVEFHDRRAELARPGRQHDGVDRACRRTADDPERVLCPPWQQLRERLEDADLECAASAPARQHQGRLHVITGGIHPQSFRSVPDISIPIVL